jgi:hypothetical protein
MLFKKKKKGSEEMWKKRIEGEKKIEKKNYLSLFGLTFFF